MPFSKWLRDCITLHFTKYYNRSIVENLKHFQNFKISDVEPAGNTRDFSRLDSSQIKS